MKTKFLIATVMSAVAMAARADIIETFPEVNFQGSGTYPEGPITIGTETYSIPAGQTITGATFSGVFGETSLYYGSTAEFDLYANGDELISTYDVIPDPYHNVVPFSVPWTDIASLDTGSVTLSFVEQSDYYVRLSPVTLDIQTSWSVPDSTGLSSVVMAGLSLIGFGRRFARKA